jgi:hypothetical protein
MRFDVLVVLASGYELEEKRGRSVGVGGYFGRGGGEEEWEWVG